MSKKTKTNSNTEVNELRQKVIEIIKAEENPFTITRDYFRVVLNEHNLSYTSVIKEFGAKTFKDLKDTMFEIAGIQVEQEEENSYIDREYFEKNSKIRDDSHLTHKRGYFVTAVIGNMPLNKKAFNSVLHYCNTKGYELVLLPMKNAYKNRADRDERSVSDYPSELEPFLEESFYTEYIFNENIRAKDFLLLPQQKKPLTGLLSYGKKQYSLIVSSPKQDMETVPVTNNKHPHIVHSTGTISLPDYFNDRVGRIATEDHINGGLIIEIDDEKTFYLRQIQFDENGGFNDIDQYYIGKKIKKAECIAVTWGDLHNKFESPEIFQATKEWTGILNPDEIYLQDSIDMHSVNPHHEKSVFDRVHKYSEIDTLEKELNAFAEKLLEINKLFPKSKIVDVPSNHPYFLIRYLDGPEARWLRDRPENVKVASELFYTRINKIDTNPIRYWIRKYFPQTDSFMVWPDEGVSFERTEKKIEMNVHGHKGPNGAKGARRGIRLAYHDANQAHSHGAFIDGGLWSAGVLGHNHLYNGSTPGNWLAVNISTYKNGQRQMQIIPWGKTSWRIDVNA